MVKILYTFPALVDQIYFIDHNPAFVPEKYIRLYLAFFEKYPNINRIRKFYHECIIENLQCKVKGENFKFYIINSTFIYIPNLTRSQ